MKLLTCCILAAAMGLTKSSEPRANFLHISVTAPKASPIRAIWRPYAGAVSSTGAEQQAALSARRLRADPDSVRRWQDPASRDTIPARTPIEFVVDMTGGPIRIETTGGDSVHVEAQLTPLRGPVAKSWGHALLIDSDGRSPYIERRR